MCCCRIFLTIFVILQFVAVAAVVIGTPFDMFRPKDSSYTSNSVCLTLWGMKNKCYSTKYEVKTADYWAGCKPRQDRFRAAQACAIITIGLFLLSFLLGIIQCCCCLCCKFICLILNVAGVATGIVVFALMLDSWFTTRGPAAFPNCGPIKTFQPEMKLGAGLALFIAAVGLGFINIFIAMLPC